MHVFVHPFSGFGVQHQATQTWRRARGQLATNHLLRRVEAGVHEALESCARLEPGTSWRVDIEVRFAAVPWKQSYYPSESHVATHIYLAPVMLELTEPQLVSLLVRTAVVAASEAGRVSADVIESGDPGFPLLVLGAIPREGVGDSWSASEDRDAYAKAAQLIGDLASPWLHTESLPTKWPMLELVPKRQARQIRAIRDSRGYEVPLPKGFAGWSKEERAQRVLADFRDALHLRVASDRSTRQHEVDELTEALSATGFQLQLRTAKLRQPGSGPWLRVEYEGDVDGGRCRAVVGGEGAETRSDWVPVGAGAAAILHLEPNVGFGWLPSGQVWLAPRGARQKRVTFEPGSAVVLPDLGDDDLPPAHPLFAAHFTEPLYDDPADEFGPFGSDEGFELVRAWAADRVAREGDATVAELLAADGGPDLSRWVRGVDLAACADPASLVDEAVLVQSAGFSLLRLAGRIDADGKQGAINALEFLIAFYGSPRQYLVQRDDLARWTG